MGYSVFKFGSLCLDGKNQLVPEQPTNDGDIPQYDGNATISFGTLAPEDSITWIKPNGSNILIADRVLLANVSWEDLDRNGFITGRPILVNGQYFRCCLLHVGDSENVPNEWDRVLDKTGEDNALWHWEEMYFWGANATNYDVTFRAARGYHSVRFFYRIFASNRYEYLGFRPALEPLSSDTPISNIILDGIDFQLTGISGGEGFCPILQPTQSNVFEGIPVENRVRMYALTENGRPIHIDEQVKDITKLTLTDRYFGDEFLIPWVISNGIAVASQSLLRQNKSQKGGNHSNEL